MPDFRDHVFLRFGGRFTIRSWQRATAAVRCGARRYPIAIPPPFCTTGTPLQ
jgi:hypothetical protein